MEPFERFRKLNTEGNLWIYVLALGKDDIVCEEEVRKLIFERFGFLPGTILLKTVLYRLKRKDYIKSERYKGKRAYRTTERGKKELTKTVEFCQQLIEKI
ncbi:hypothetical protein J7J18_00435 [bacterium]|nr:hypothetical protein [bacterium]